MEQNAIDLVVYLFGISIFILLIVLYLVLTNPDNDEVLVDDPKDVEPASIDELE